MTEVLRPIKNISIGGTRESIIGGTRESILAWSMIQSRNEEHMDQTDPFKDFDKNFNRAVKAGKAFMVVVVAGSLAMVGLVIWVAVHFISKWW